jgi:NADH dehydrogenase
MERRLGVPWVPADIGSVGDWAPIVRGATVVVNLAWYRWGTPQEFHRLAEGARRLVGACAAERVGRFVQLSVPEAPPHLAQSLPYFTERARLLRTLSESGVPTRVIRPTLLFGRGDRLIGVMMRLMHRYHRFPMFGDGAYHVSPLATTDLAAIIAEEAAGTATGSVDIGGPRRYVYRELTDQLFKVLGRAPRYVRISPRNALRLTALMVAFRSTLLYPYEVDWLVSDRLGLPAYTGLGRPLTPLEPYLVEEAQRLTGTSVLPQP